ncbi:MAG TPA: hypothetical protein PLI19_04830 [Erysipelotrichaceae bacterium]|nr:hypothetical protein [Erysipelotrichaceae bacterium]HQB32637.1 hypothetical protein [Erysipelotrichaceae bacterium]
MARYRRKDSGPGSWLVIIILISVFSGLAEFVLGSAFGLLGLFFEVIVPLLMFAGILFAPLIFIGIGIKIIVDAIKKHRGVSTSKTVSSTATPTVSHKRLLKQINKFFDKNQQLNIDEETYLLLTDRNNVSLETIDIYMREEYIGTLKDYFNAYPNSFNSLSNLISKYLNAKNLNEKQVVEEIKKEVTRTFEKDCAFYIKELSQLKDGIENQQVTKGLEETIHHLKAIKKIEDEFTESKSKTVKLYQYYLPMLTDIVNNYKRLSLNVDSNADFKNSEDRLLKTTVLINGALSTISGSLVEDYYTELNVDMRTLESILKKDGLVDELQNQEG